MHIYTIHEHGDTPQGQRDPDAKIIREGFSILALVFGILWFLFHRMWRESLLIAVVMAVIVLVIQGGQLADPTGLALRAVFGLGLALFAHDLQRAALARKGYREVGVASGGNKEEAALEYLLQAGEISGSDETPVSTVPAASDVIGHKETKE